MINLGLMSRASLPWWKQTTVYQIYPRSFADDNGDGIGDLAGVIARLDYLKWLGIETIWISPFFKSPQADFGYDISDHFEVAPEYGSLEDCRRLIDAVHAHGMKIVLDMVLNHTSNQHPWFLESKQSRHSPRRDFYIWRDGRKPHGAAPPNNWKSMLGGSGWHYDPATEQWYWASFLPFQPDLNYRNPQVKQAMLDMVRHWLRQGADGLRLDIFNAIHKDAGFADNPFSFRPIPSEHNPDGFFQRAVNTQNHPDTLAFARELRAVVDEFQHPPRFLVGEVFGPTSVLREYCGPLGEGLNLVFLFKSLSAKFTAPGFRDLMQEFETAFPEPLHPTYVFGNHDRPRSIERLGNDRARARLLAAFQLTVRGVPFVYYGDELGLPHHEGMALHSALDPVAARYRFLPKFLLPTLRKRGILVNRDECRSPMPWHGGAHAGFAPPGAPSPWLPLHPQSAILHVEGQRQDPDSLLACYRRMLLLRRASPALSNGSLQLCEPLGDPRRVLAFRRVHEDEEALVLLNFSRKETPVDLRAHPNRVLFSNLVDESIQGFGRQLLRPWEGVVLFSRPPQERT